MEDKRNRSVGSDIHDMVKDAVSNMDFKKLNSEITISVNNALAEVRNALGMQADGDRQKGDTVKPGTWRPANSEVQQKPERQQNQQQNRQGIQEQQVSQRYPENSLRDSSSRNRSQHNNDWRSWNRQGSPPANVRIDEVNQPRQQMRRGIRIPYVPKGKIVGVLTTIFGSLSTAGFGISLLVFGILMFTLHEYVFVQLFGSFILPFIISCMFLKAGRKLRARNRRQNIYLKQLQYRGYASIKELSNAIGESERFVLKDVKKMLSLGMFPEGYIDQKGTCFIATRENYEIYSTSQKGYEQRLIEDNRRLLEEQERLLKQNYDMKNKYEKQMPIIDDPYEGLPPEIKETIVSGREHIKLIKEANEAIVGEDISKKLDRLELVIDRILYHIEKHPKKITEIRRFMDYYLPTTLKLVMTYKDFDLQPLQGENMLTAKIEIMKTLDTINYAFEKLLDSMFEEAAIDVSTDISVLETMLAQEGLTESDFTVNQDERKL